MTDASTDRPGAKRRVALASAVLVVLTFAVYAGAARNDFVDYDDGAYIVQNEHVTAGLTLEGIRWAFTSPHASNWHPLTWLSHMLDVQLFGLDPGAHHLVSVALHALNAVLLLVLLTSWTGRFWPGVLVAALFAVHPLRVESVAWAAERKDVLSGTLFFASLLLYTSYARRPSVARYLWVALALSLGLMAKPMLVTVPFVLLVVDFWPLARKESWSRLVVEKLPLLGLAAASSVATYLVQHAAGAVRSLEVLPSSARLSNTVVAYAGYLWKSVWPVDLTFFYPHPALVASETYTPWSAGFFLSGTLLLGLTLLAFARRKAQGHVLAGWLVYLGMLVPVIGVVHVGAHWIADRYAYLPQVGVLVALVFGLADLATTSRRRKVLGALGVLAVGACIPVTWRQVGHWRDSRTLFEHAFAVTERNYVAHSNLGFLEQNEGNLEAAKEQYLAALEIAPWLADAQNNLGAVHLYEREYSQAVTRLELALRLRPDWDKPRVLLAVVHQRMGTLDAQRARAALPCLERAVQGREPPVLALEALAWILATSAAPDLRDPEQALRLAVPLTHRSKTWSAFATLAAAHAAAAEAGGGSFDRALAALGQALSLAPTDRMEELMRMRELFRSGKALHR